MKDSYYMQQ